VAALGLVRLDETVTCQVGSHAVDRVAVDDQHGFAIAAYRRLDGDLGRALPASEQRRCRLDDHGLLLEIPRTFIFMLRQP
jgi:hypothetical protein